MHAQNPKISDHDYHTSTVPNADLPYQKKSTHNDFDLQQTCLLKSTLYCWKKYCAVSSSAVGAAEASASDPSMANARAVRATEERPGIAIIFPCFDREGSHFFV